MSAVTSQPLPFGPLEREKHIQGVFRAFKNRCGPSCECQTHPAEPNRTKGFLTGNPMDMIQISMLTGGRRTCPRCASRRIYSITTGSSKSQMVVAVEESSCVGLQCHGPARARSFQGFDYQGRQVFYFERPLRADTCCFGCCLMEMRAYSPQKHLIGTVCQRWSMFTPLLEVCDPEGGSTIQIQGPCCLCRCLPNQKFQIVSNIGEQIGTIWKKWPGFSDERNMDHEYFELEIIQYWPLFGPTQLPIASVKRIPQDDALITVFDMLQRLDPQTKLLLLAATFLLASLELLSL